MASVVQDAGVLALLSVIVAGLLALTGVVLGPVVARRVNRPDHSRKAVSDDLDILNRMPPEMREGPEGKAVAARVSAGLGDLDKRKAAGPPDELAATMLRITARVTAVTLVSGVSLAVWLFAIGEQAAVIGGMAGFLILSGGILLGLTVAQWQEHRGK